MTGKITICAAALAWTLAGCGGHSGSGFGWLHPRPVPGDWRSVRISTGAVLSYPPAWRRIAGDRGTATAVLRGPHDQIVGYLNVTPRQGKETASNWGSFRTEHNAEEGDRRVVRLAVASGLRFRTGRVSCVRDSYATASGARYIELACLVSGGRGTSVIVGATPPQSWSQVAPSIERAISGFTT
jgi:hypothetical protein